MSRSAQPSKAGLLAGAAGNEPLRITHRQQIKPSAGAVTGLRTITTPSSTSGDPFDRPVADPDRQQHPAILRTI